MIARLISLAKEKPETLFYLVAGFLVVSIGLVVAIDVFDAFGWRTAWLAGDEYRSFFWWHWFSEPVENPIQWFLLALGMSAFALGAGAAYEREDSQGFRFALFMSIGLALMFIEDAADPRHRIRMDLESYFGSGSYGVLGTAIELIYFALLGGLLLYAFFRFRQAFWPHDKARRYLIRGFAFYGIAVSSSWLGSAFRSVTSGMADLYSVTGELFVAILFFDGGKTEQLYWELDAQTQEILGRPLSFYFMDRVWEESFELLGAAALVVAGFAYFRATTKAVRDEAE